MIRHYRIDNVRHGLGELGYTSLFVDLQDVTPALLADFTCRIAVFVRAPYTAASRAVLEYFKSRGVRTVFDIDDLVFDPSIVEHVDGIQRFTEKRKARYTRGQVRYRAFMDQVDRVTVSTHFLRDYLHARGFRNVSVVRNSLAPQSLSTFPADQALVPRTDRFVVGYYSGTATHQKDFSVCVSELAGFMRRHPEVRLRIVGQLDLGEFRDLDPLAERIDRIGIMPHHEMLQDQLNCDVVIASLETGNPFCEAKSELKFFEAAVAGVPTVVSATSVFSRATQDGRLALLAHDKDEWGERLERLYASPALRASLAERARQWVRQNYSCHTSAREAQEAYFGNSETLQEAGDARPEPVDAPTLDIGVLLVSVQPGSGGRRNILSVCRDWARAGCRVTVYVKTALPDEDIKNTLEANYFDLDLNVERHGRHLDARHDALICTFWRTAYDLRRHEHPRRVFYFVQDFEPMFYPVGTHYMKCLSTYGSGFNIVCRGPWVADRLRREGVPDVMLLPVPLDHAHYTSGDVQKTVDILFYARPTQDRRCYELGVEALTIVKQRSPGVRIGLFGQGRYEAVGFPYENFGEVLELSALADLYRRSRLGMCFSPTNPSSVGYEMLGCKLPFMDIRAPGWQHSFGGKAFVLYAEPTPEAIAAEALEALSDPTGLERRGHAGHDFARRMPSEQDLAAAFLDVVVRTLSGVAPDSSGEVER